MGLDGLGASLEVKATELEAQDLRITNPAGHGIGLALGPKRTPACALSASPISLGAGLLRRGPQGDISLANAQLEAIGSDGIALEVPYAAV